MVLNVKVVDALDEDGWIWVGFNSPPVQATEIDGVQVPPAAAGDVRMESTVTTLIEPRLRGASVTMIGLVKMAGVSYKVVQ
eukprot:5421976-Amphidinium_carterae.1